MGWVSGKESQREREKRETENVVNAIITKVMDEMCFCLSAGLCILPSCFYVRGENAKRVERRG